MTKNDHGTAEDADKIQNFKLRVTLFRERLRQDLDVVNNIEAAHEL